MTTMDEKSHLIIIYVFRGYDTFMKICSFKKCSLIVNLLLHSADSHPCSCVYVQSDSLSRPCDYDQLAFLFLFLKYCYHMLFFRVKIITFSLTENCNNLSRKPQRKI